MPSRWAQLWLPNQLRSCGLDFVAPSPGTHLVQTGELGTCASKRECKGPSVTEKGQKLLAGFSSEEGSPTSLWTSQSLISFFRSDKHQPGLHPGSGGVLEKGAYHSVNQYMFSTCCVPGTVPVVLSNPKGRCTRSRQVKGFLLHGLYSAGSQVGAASESMVSGLRPKGRTQLNPQKWGLQSDPMQQVHRSRVRMRLSCSREQGGC